MPDDVHLIKEIRDIRARRLLRTLAVVQDLSDALMAINDVTGTTVHAMSAGTFLYQPMAVLLCSIVLTNNGCAVRTPAC